MPRVLMFAPAFAPHLFSEGIVNSKLALAMKNNGWEVDVIAMPSEMGPRYESAWSGLWAPLKPIRCDAELVSGRKGIHRILGLTKDSIVTRHPIPGVHWSRMALQEALALHEKNPYDLVLSRSLSCCAHLPALMFKRHINSVPWVANWNDPPPYLFPPPYSFTMSIFQRWMSKRYFRTVAKAADVNTFPSQRLYEHMRNELGIKDNMTIKVLHHIGLDGFVSTPWVKRNTLTFCHAGNLSTERYPETFLDAFKNIVNRYQNHINISCIVIGLESVGLSTLIENKKLQHFVKFYGDKSFEDTLKAIGQSDVAVLIEAPIEEGIFLPSKVIDYAQAGRPILAVSPKNGVLRDLIENYGGGLHCDNTQAAQIEEAMEKLVRLWLRDKLNIIDTKKLASLSQPEHTLEFFKSLMAK